MARTSQSGISASAVQNSTHTYAVDAEASDSYAITLSPAITAYADGQEFTFKANTLNTGAASLNVNGLGAKTIKKNHDQDLVTGDVEAGSILEVSYDGTVFQLLSTTAATPATGDMEASTYDPAGIEEQLAGLTATQTFTNKRINKRTITITSSATPTPAGDTTDIFTITALSEAAAIAAPTGTPVNDQKLIIRIKDDGTGRALTYNAIYRAIGIELPTTTVSSKTMYLGFVYNSTDSKWDALAVGEEA